MTKLIDDLLNNDSKPVKPKIEGEDMNLGSLLAVEPVAGIPEQPKSELNIQHPLNRPAEIPPIPAPYTIGTAKDEADAYKYVQENMAEFMYGYEEGFVPSFERDPLSGGMMVAWKYAPDYSESTLIKYHEMGKTSTQESFKKKIDEVVRDRVEDRDMTRVLRFLEVVDYDTDACRPILEGDSGFLSEIADMDVVDLNIKYFQLKTLQSIDRKLALILESFVKVLGG